MDNKIFYKSNKSLLAVLIVLLSLSVISGGVGMLFLHHSSERTMFYYESINRAKDTRAVIQTHINNWNNIVLAKAQSRSYRELYYDFTKDYATIHAQLTGLKAMMYDNHSLLRLIEKIHKDYRAMSDGYVSFIIRIDDADGAAANEFARILKKGESETLNDIETVVKEIQTLSDRELERVNRYYVVMIRMSFILMSAISFIMVAQVIMTNRRVQKMVISIGSRLNSYLPRQLVVSIINNGTTVRNALDKKEVTVCFTDLQGFTAMTEKLDPDVTAKIMNEYLTEMSAIARQYDGMIDKFIGDGIMILFGAFDVNHRESHALNCVKMAVAMQKNMRFLKYRWTGEGIDHGLNLRIGINTGIATVGSFGPPDRQTFTAVGTSVNIASRLEGICPLDKILIGEETRSLLSGRILTKQHDVQNVKGIEKPVRSYEVLYEVQNLKSFEMPVRSAAEVV